MAKPHNITPLENIDDVEEWLQTQPRDICVVFAARAALHAAPAFSQLVIDGNISAEHANTIILPCFRALAAALSAGTWPDRAAADAADAAYAAARAAATAARAADAAASAATDAAYAAARAARAATARAARAATATTATADAATDAAYAADATTYAADATTYAAAYVADAFYPAYTQDAQAVANGKDATSLAALPLWQDQSAPNYGQPPELAAKWQSLKTALLQKDEDWQIWTHWYEQRLRGGALNKEREIAFVTELSQEDWKKGKTNAGYVNGKLKAILERFTPDELPEQDPGAENFNDNAEGKIALSAPTDGMYLTDTPEQREWYAQLREAVQDMRTDYSNNQLGTVNTPLARLDENLPPDIKDAIVARVWSRCNYLRILLKKHDNAIKDKDDNFAHDKLDPSIATTMEHVTGPFHNLAVNDPGLRNAETVAKGPQEESEKAETDKIARSVIQDAMERGIVDETAASVLQETFSAPANDNELSPYDGEIEQQAEITQPSIPQRLQQQQNRKTHGNFIAALIYSARKIRDGAILEVGKKLWTFVIDMGNEILAYVARQWPTFLSIVERILTGHG